MVTAANAGGGSWKLALNGGSFEEKQGKTAAVVDLMPGDYRVSAEGLVGGSLKTAEALVRGEAGEIKEVELTLE